MSDHFIPALRGAFGEPSAIESEFGDAGVGAGSARGRRALAPAVALIGVEWGPAQVRVHAFDARGGVLATRDSARGLTTLASPREFADALDELLGVDLDDGRAPILLTGMAGARAGWQETPYARLPADARTLASMLQPLPFRGRRAAIVPGVSAPSDGYIDVMRGEETQALGVPPGTARLVAPGAHSKWIALDGGALTGFSTYPTGELYELLLERSLLGRGLPARSWSQRGFELGLDTARERPDWLHQLFGVRARNVRDAAPPAELPAFLSGLLIGYECLGANAGEQAGGEVAIVGDAHLAATYACALRRYGVPHYIIEGDTAFCRGLWRIAQTAGYA
ncbi:2-dehydro-3-deoxygalactonokinase [Lysobacter sp. K5869]|uniref:2-dehydro-3-deoxygalactonokinase n=1 Tax=Lysobacter sp. K5869 TaxID=2820808 RepID=UPI001C0644A7|nr:2-dehydro-3-deoxygalactonokinase [Lysobacter sp. K5869]QWP78220.1 2-dehydro-3-deoxygalactonokinase [Lysobacter sp. K5869]